MSDLMDKIDALKLKEVLEEKEMSFTKDDIISLMDMELEKAPSEMNTNLVDLCVAVLEGDLVSCEADAKAKPSKRKVKVSKVFLVAAVIVLMSLIAISVCARYTYGEASDKIAEYCYDHFKINLRIGREASLNDEEVAADTLTVESLDMLELPEFLLGDDYIKNIQIYNNDLISTLYADFVDENTDIYGNIDVTRYRDENIQSDAVARKVPDDFKSFKQLRVGQTDVLVFAKDENSYITYIVGNTEYSILLHTDFDTAVKIAESIKFKSKG